MNFKLAIREANIHSIYIHTDHGLEVLSQWVTQTEFPWLMSNVLDNETGRPLGEGKITHVVHAAGRRIGLLGLVEKEWLDTLATINPEEVTFLDFIEAGQKLASQLKQEVNQSIGAVKETLRFIFIA